MQLWCLEDLTNQEKKKKLYESKVSANTLMCCHRESVDSLKRGCGVWALALQPDASDSAEALLSKAPMHLLNKKGGQLVLLYAN